MKHSLLYFAIILIGISSCKENYESVIAESAEPVNYIPVRVEKIERGQEEVPLYAIGRISSDTETKLSFKTGGYISKLRVREGDFIRKGKLLGSLRTEEIDAQVLKAQRANDKAARDLSRVSAMYKDSVATLENVEDLTTLVEVSGADLKIAKFNQQYSKIIAPISGRVIKRLAEPNELVSPGQPIFIIGSSGNQSYNMKVYISDKDINMISYGTKAVLSFDAFANVEFEGKVNRISESADPMTGTFEVELSIATGKERLRNGMIGRVRLYPSQTTKFLKIPTVALSEGEGDEVTIFVPDETDTIALARRVQVSRFGDGHIWVDSRALEEDRVVTFGSAYLRDGEVIKIIEKNGKGF